MYSFYLHDINARYIIFLLYCIFVSVFLPVCIGYWFVSCLKDNAVRLWTINNATGDVDCRAVGIGHNRTVSAVVLLK